MTVYELIQELAKYKPDAKIVIDFGFAMDGEEREVQANSIVLNNYGGNTVHIECEE